jgi:hypothetical protein
VLETDEIYESPISEPAAAAETSEQASISFEEPPPDFELDPEPEFDPEPELELPLELLLELVAPTAAGVVVAGAHALRLTSTAAANRGATMIGERRTLRRTTMVISSTGIEVQ